MAEKYAVQLMYIVYLQGYLFQLNDEFCGSTL